MKIDLAEAVLLATLALVFVTTGTLDYEDEVAGAEFYCEQVRDNYWPDYNPDIHCEE